MFNRILLATDGSNHALKAAEAAAEIAKHFDAVVTVLYVFQGGVTLAPVAGVTGSNVDPSAESLYAQRVQDAVAQRTGKVLEGTGVRYTVRQETGHPAEAIVRIADTEGYDLVVVGNRGLGGFQSFLLGSTSDRVAHHAHCPVLIVR